MNDLAAPYVPRRSALPNDTADRLVNRNSNADFGVYGAEFPGFCKRPITVQLPAKEKVERAEAAVLETIVFGGLIATAIAAAIYDIGFWLGAW